MEKPLSGRLVAQVAGGLERFAMKEITTLGGKNIEVVLHQLPSVLLFDWVGPITLLRKMRSVDFISALLAIKQDLPLDQSAIPILEQLPQSVSWDVPLAFWASGMKEENPGLSMREERQARERAREKAVAAEEARKAKDQAEAKEANNATNESAPAVPGKRPPSPAAQDITEAQTAKKRKDEKRKKKEQKKETKRTGETDWRIGELSAEETRKEFRVMSYTAPSFRVNCDRSGSQQWRSPEVERHVGGGVVAARGWKVDLRNYDLEVHALCFNTTVILSVRLTRDALYERNRWALNLTALRPSVAFCLLQFAGDLVVDPMCGSGTIPIEAIDGFGAIGFGGDYSAIAVAKAHYNARRARVHMQPCLWDAGSGIADAFVCDMPFGNLCGSAQGNRKFYPRILNEMSRVCTAHGRAVVLTQERNLVRSVIKESSAWVITSEIQILMSGADITAFRLDRKTAQESAVPTQAEK